MDIFLENAMPSLDWDNLDIVEDFPNKLPCTSDHNSEKTHDSKIVSNLILKLYQRALDAKMRNEDSTCEAKAA
jgi:hypothetical protein